MLQGICMLEERRTNIDYVKATVVEIKKCGRGKNVTVKELYGRGVAAKEREERGFCEQ